MKENNKYIVLAIAAATFVGCTDLDTIPEGYYVTEDQKNETVILDPDKAEAGVNAVFAQFNQYCPNADALGGLSRHNDFGYAGLMMMMDANGYDIPAANNGYNWAGNELTYEDRINTSLESTIFWNTLYKQVFTTNSVIASIDAETTDPVSQFYLAQGLAGRAFNYWVLAQLYQFNYVGNESKPCVPLVTEENASTAGVEGCPRATVAEVYELIMSDLNKAVELLETTTKTPSDKRYISKAVAYGLRARVNLTMQKWNDAASDADKAIASFSGRPYAKAEVSVPTFWDSNDNAWMWAILIAETDRVVTSGIVNWPSHMHSLCYGYNTYVGGRQINKALYNTIPDSDVRKGWWLNENLESPNLNSEQAAFVEKAKYPAYTNVKFGPYQNIVGSNTNANDIPLMRIEEMYLIKAESLAMGGNTNEAKNVLESFVKTYRDESYTCRFTSAADLQNEVYRQRRIELWGEGLSWFDILRLNRDMDRRGGGYNDAAIVLNIPAGSPILLYRLPEAEIQSNPQISEADNNEAAPAPSPVPDVE